LAIRDQGFEVFEMRCRALGNTGWTVSEIGYGMWGMAGWTGSDDEESARSLDRAVALGCTFFDTAWAYGEGHSEELLGQLVKRHPDKRLYTATKIPPKNRQWPARAEYPLDEVFPPDYIREYTERSLRNMDLPSVDLQQFHVWSDAWADDDAWQRAVAALKEEKLVGAIGISVNRWQPANVLKALATGLVDAVQVVYNLFDQNPEDALFPECERRGVAVIARVPFDEGSLTGTLSLDSRWPEGDFRNTYFKPEHLRNTIERIDRLRPDLPAGTTMTDTALRFILANPAVSTVIPGMRKLRHVEANIAASDAPRLSGEQLRTLKRHRWER
jgi:aryl-alcohol dehydrogenase-like predicted oxidoreductase